MHTMRDMISRKIFPQLHCPSESSSIMPPTTQRLTPDKLHKNNVVEAFKHHSVISKKEIIHRFDRKCIYFLPQMLHDSIG
jgi:hypothetical protein